MRVTTPTFSAVQTTVTAPKPTRDGGKGWALLVDLSTSVSVMVAFTGLRRAFFAALLGTEAGLQLSPGHSSDWGANRRLLRLLNSPGLSASPGDTPLVHRGEEGEP